MSGTSAENGAHTGGNKIRTLRSMGRCAGGGEREREKGGWLRRNGIQKNHGFLLKRGRRFLRILTKEMGGGKSGGGGN